MSNRWSKQRAFERCEPLSRFMWRSLPIGLAVFAVVNVVQLAWGWSSYRDGWVAALLLVILASVFMLVWYRSLTGVGPVLSALALVTGPAACLIIATQLDQTALTGLANWVSGFCIVPIILLPFSRPLEEMVLGVAALVGVQGFVMADAGRTLRDLHTIVMSGGAGAVIGVGTVFLVAVIRQMDTIRRGQAQRALDMIWSQIYRQDTSVMLQRRVTVSETAAAQMLDALAAGTADVADPEVQRKCAALSADLRRELLDLGQSSLLLAEILPADGELRWVIDDEDNLSQHFHYKDRLLLVKALRSLLSLVPDGVSVRVKPLPRVNRAMVVVTSDLAALLDTPDWRTARQRFAVCTTAGSARGERWLYSWNMSVNRVFWEK